MADKKDKSKETKGSAHKAAPKSAKADGKPKAQAKETKKSAKPAATSEGGVAKAAPVKTEPPRMLLQYKETVIPALMKEFSYKNPMQAPKLVKIVLNVGLGEAIANAKALDFAVDELGRITGQRPVITKAKKSIAAFKLREGMPIGCSVTLRREHMFEFLDRFISAALPRIRDFKGVPTKSFDGRGNYTLGIKEQIIFPEIEYDKVESVHGMDVVFVTTANTDEEGRALLRHLGMPFKK
jgi:large subunit ribosomal protein L5